VRIPVGSLGSYMNARAVSRDTDQKTLLRSVNRDVRRLSCCVSRINKRDTM
jgi:hypothetical protein